MAKDDKNGPQIDDETRESLEQVKKGKPRKFVMLCKAASIVTLVVYKKGSVENFKKQVREAGTGQIYFGVVDGGGADFNFRLARSDGFDKEPVKATVLRNFLKDVADISCKPLFVIVDVPPLVLDEDDSLVQRFIKLQAAALTACDAKPERAGEINSLCLEIGRRLDQDLRDQAEAGIEQLESLVTSLGSSPSPTAPTSTSRAEAKGSTNDQAPKLAGTLKSLKPLIDKAIEADPTRKNDLLQAMTQIATEIKQGLLDDAKMHLLSLAKSVQEPAATKTSDTGPTPDAAKLKYEELRDRLEPLLNAARRANPEKSNGLLNLWNYAGDLGDAGSFNNANTALEKLEDAIRKAVAEAPQKDTDRFGIREGIVAERRQELEEYFKKRVAEVELANHEEVRGLRVAIEEQSPEESNPDQLESDINSALRMIYDDMRTRLLNSLASDSVDVVLAAVEECRETVDNDELIRHLMTAHDSLDVNVRFQDRFDELFDEILAEVNKEVAT